MRVDTADRQWRDLANAAPMPVAGGENFTTAEMFAEAIASGAYGIIQPDVAKWGGISGCFEVGRKALDAGRTYCPHFLGGAIGLFASAHLMAAVGGSGMLEIDANDNPLRGAVTTAALAVAGGELSLSDAPGLGAEPDLPRIAQFETWRGEATA
jgi:D-galactarolactone cycloisomerase